MQQVQDRCLQMSMLHYQHPPQNRAQKNWLQQHIDKTQTKRALPASQTTQPNTQCPRCDGPKPGAEWAWCKSCKKQFRIRRRQHTSEAHKCHPQDRRVRGLVLSFSSLSGGLLVFLLPSLSTMSTTTVYARCGSLNVTWKTPHPPHTPHTYLSSSSDLFRPNRFRPARLTCLGQHRFRPVPL